MAHASTEAGALRSTITALANAAAAADAGIQRYDDLGGADFFGEYLADAEGNPTTDVTVAEFVTGIETVRLLLKALTPEVRASIAKLRI